MFFLHAFHTLHARNCKIAKSVKLQNLTGAASHLSRQQHPAVLSLSFPFLVLLSVHNLSLSVFTNRMRFDVFIQMTSVILLLLHGGTGVSAGMTLGEEASMLREEQAQEEALLREQKALRNAEGHTAPTADRAQISEQGSPGADARTLPDLAVKPHEPIAVVDSSQISGQGGAAAPPDASAVPKKKKRVVFRDEASAGPLKEERVYEIQDREEPMKKIPKVKRRKRPSLTKEQLQKGSRYRQATVAAELDAREVAERLERELAGWTPAQRVARGATLMALGVAIIYFLETLIPN